MRRLLSEISTLITKGTTPTTRDGGFTLEGINYVKSESLSYSGEIDTSCFAHISEETHKKLRRSQIQENDILYSIAGANLGKCGLATQGMLPANTNQAVAIIRIDASKADPRFVSYVLRDRIFVENVLAGVAQSAQPNVNLSEIGRFKIPALSLQEQRSIASTLGALDDKIDLNRQMNETLEAMARAIFKDWFVDFGPTRAKMEGRAPYLAPEIWSLFPDRLDAEGKPEGWADVPLSSFFEIIGGGTPKTSVEAYWGGGIPWFSVVDTPPGGSLFVFDTEKTITSLGLAESSACLVPAGTTIISARGTVGNLAIAARDMTFNQSCYALCSKGAVGGIFVFLTAQNMVARLQAMAHGSVFSTITRSTFEAITSPLPTGALLKCFEEATKPLFAKIKANVDESRALASTRDLLLPKLMSGEIRVQDAEKTLEQVA
ncbi:restriction endonuclease subunit S [Acidocella sp.]|uniref:restriction endonuclease subunit S n=1 Tax=Acidocella sp. TaxID=50710 RepID=UPI002633E809|nr:restriction endonuclease subunit S [Acidocella sp.]